MDTHGSIGETLRRRREERGLSPEQAASQSKVPIRLMQVLESDDYHLTPDPFYLVRLLREYAAFLGLDPAAIDAEFQQAIQRPPRASLAVAPAPGPPATIPWKQVVWIGAGILAIMPVILIVLSLASKRADDRAAQAPAAPPRVENPAPADTPAPGAAPDRASQAPTGAEEAPAPSLAGTPDVRPSSLSRVESPAPAQRHVLLVRAQEATWMSVKADGKEPREVLLQAGDTARFEAGTDFRVTVGNAGGVTLTLNGTALPSLGRSGEVVRDVVLPPLLRGSSSSSGDAVATPSR